MGSKIKVNRVWWSIRPKKPNPWKPRTSTRLSLGHHIFSGFQTPCRCADQSHRTTTTNIVSQHPTPLFVSFYSIGSPLFSSSSSFADRGSTSTVFSCRAFLPWLSALLSQIVVALLSLLLAVAAYVDVVHHPCWCFSRHLEVAMMVPFFLLPSYVDSSLILPFWTSLLVGFISILSFKYY